MQLVLVSKHCCIQTQQNSSISMSISSPFGTVWYVFKYKSIMPTCSQCFEIDGVCLGWLSDRPLRCLIIATSAKDGSSYIVVKSMERDDAKSVFAGTGIHCYDYHHFHLHLHQCHSHYHQNYQNHLFFSWFTFLHPHSSPSPLHAS